MANPTQMIPLVDLNAQYAAHSEEFDAVVRDCVARSSFIGGPAHKEFRDRFAQWCGGGFAALVGNGTDALVLAMIELLGEGDGEGEVITVSHTFIATSEAIRLAGYKPVFVEINPDTYLMDIKSFEAAIGPRTRAVIPVHLYGQMLDIQAIRGIADAHGIFVIEDAAQAHGARYDGSAPGGIGDAACFSFYPGKNLGAWGDGGAVFSRDANLIERIVRRANHGRSDKYLHEFEGTNSRLDGLQAAILNVKMNHIDDWTRARRNAAGTYDKLLSGQNGVKLPYTDPKAEHVYHLYVVEVEERDLVKQRLNDQGIGAGVHYPVPLHMQPACRHLRYAPGDLPLTQAAASRVLSLPIFPEISHAQIERVCEALEGALAS